MGELCCSGEDWYIWWPWDERNGRNGLKWEVVISTVNVVIDIESYSLKLRISFNARSSCTWVERWDVGGG